MECISPLGDSRGKHTDGLGFAFTCNMLRFGVLCLGVYEDDGENPEDEWPRETSDAETV